MGNGHGNGGASIIRGIIGSWRRRERPGTGGPSPHHAGGKELPRARPVEVGGAGVRAVRVQDQSEEDCGDQQEAADERQAAEVRQQHEVVQQDARQAQLEEVTRQTNQTPKPKRAPQNNR